MPRGYWDWGVNPTGLLTASEIDRAELAARLGSIDTYERLGNVIFLDGLEDGLAKWRQDGNGTGNTVEISVARARNGGYSARLVAGSNGSAFAAIERTITTPTLSRHALEVSFSRDTTLDYFYWIIWYYTGSQVHQYEVRWDFDASALQVHTLPNDWVTIATGISVLSLASDWYTAKLVVDLALGTYVRLRFGNHTYDLAAYQPVAVANSQAPHIAARVELFGVIGVNSAIFIDDVILTHNEP